MSNKTYYKTIWLSDLHIFSDVFVFPSTWDTFGLVQIESNGCGVPIATYDSSISSKDVITNGKITTPVNHLKKLLKNT